MDLGTTNCVLAYCGKSNAQTRQIRLFEVEQLVAAGEVKALPLLPSVRYQAMPGELAAQDLALPWASSDDTVFGRFARQLGMQVPGRLVSSAKSWLSHPAVDRTAAILPWGANQETVAKVSPLAASASYLAYLRAAWLAHFPKAPLELQEIVLTLPASFDEGARALTLEAARLAGLPHLRLLEEPQAAFYDWLYRHQHKLEQALADSRLVLVVDVGGGTTDFSLIAVEREEDQSPRLSRIGVGNHLMLGGDNMDLALAHLVESRLHAATGAKDATGATSSTPERLSSARLAQLMERCRAAKEILLAADAPERTTVTLLGGGGKLIGGSKSIEINQADISTCLLDGFFPLCASTDVAKRSKSAVLAFGLPYAFDAAITRHLASFLQQHARAIETALGLEAGTAPAIPDTILLNGGVFRAAALVERLTATLSAWRGAAPRILHNENPDVAVARGAVAYALAHEGRAPKIGGGSARSYFLVIDSAKNAPQQAICLLPRGTEPGQEQLLSQHSFALRLGQAVRFHLVSSIVQEHNPQLGEVVNLADGDFLPLPVLATALQAPPGWQAGKQEIAVQVACRLTELGSLELHCVAQDAQYAGHRWQLAFQLRQSAEEAPVANEDETPNLDALPANFNLALDKIERIFGSRAQQVEAKEVKQLRGQLEHILGSRERWRTSLLRALFDALWQRQKARRRSIEHEKQWLNLIGYCLRPGFGDALDSWRISQLWPLFEQGAQYKHDSQVCAQWWTLWRRVAGGLNSEQQLRLLDDFALNLQGSAEDLKHRPPNSVPGAYQDMLRLGAALERIPPAYKAEIGVWLFKQLKPENARQAQALSSHQDTLFWALARIGARQPFYAGWEQVVEVEVVQAWLHNLLAMDWRKTEAAAFAATHLARMTGERSRDIDSTMRSQVVSQLQPYTASASWQQMGQEVEQQD